MRGMAGQASISVVEGDQETALDASRILAAGSKVVQVNTGSAATSTPTCWPGRCASSTRPAAPS